MAVPVLPTAPGWNQRTGTPVSVFVVPVAQHPRKGLTIILRPTLAPNAHLPPAPRNARGVQAVPGSAGSAGEGVLKTEAGEPGICAPRLFKSREEYGLDLFTRPVYVCG
jgi:hypothetical protein